MLLTNYFRLKKEKNIMSKKFNIVVASDIGMKNFITPCIDSIILQGYEPMIYDLGGLGFGKEFTANVSDRFLRKFPAKPYVIIDALSRLEPESWLAWIDADCIMQGIIDDAISDDYHIGVTFRKSGLNSGILFARHNSQSFKFLEEWGKRSINLGGDQKGLNNLCNITCASSKENVFNIEETLVKVFDAKIYNNFFFKKDQSNAKIIHYKSKFRYRFPFYDYNSNT